MIFFNVFTGYVDDLLSVLTLKLIPILKATIENINFVNKVLYNNCVMKKLTNKNIPYEKILLIQPDGSIHGECDKAYALKMAANEGLDLVLINYNASKNEAVCRICDANKMFYDTKKNKKKPDVIKIKEVKLRVNTDVNDLKRKYNDIIRIIEDGYKVKVSIFVRKRDIKKNKDAEMNAKQILSNLTVQLGEDIQIEQNRVEDYFLVISEKKVKKK